MYQRPTIEALQKRNPNLKVKPGVFSDHSHFIAKPYIEENKKKGKTNQSGSDVPGRRDKITASSFENVFKGSTHMTSENDPASSVFDNNENYGPEYVFSTNFNDLKPLEERVNRPPTRASVGEKPLHSRSDKAFESHEDSNKNMRRQSSVSSLQKRSYQKNLSSYENVYASDAENRDNSPNLRVNHMSNGAKPKGNANFVSCEGDSNRSHNFNRTRSLGKINPHGENTKARTPEASIMAYIEEKEEQAKLEGIMKENMDLWNNSKRLSAELQTERNRALMLENELQALNTSMTEERAKYQEEFIKISQEIKKFQNIQNAYIKEKKSSQTLEQQLNIHEKALSDMTCFVRECLQTLVKELEIIIIKGDVAFEKNFKNQDFNPEDFFKFCSELKKPILQKLDAAEKQNFKFDWKTHDYDQLLKYNKELEKLRKAQDFKILPNKSTFEESYQKSLANNSVSPNTKSPLNAVLPQYNSSRSRKNSLPRSINNSYKSNDHSTSDLRTYESQQKEEKYIPLNYRINLAEFNVQPQSSKRDDHMNSITDDSESRNISKRRSVSVPKVHETDVSLQEILGSQITNPRLKDFSQAPQTFDNLLSEGIQPRSEHAVNVEDLNTKQSEVSPLNRRGQFNELAQFSSQVDAGLDSIKNQILSRMSNIEARRRSSLEGARQFTLDINKMPSQDLSHNNDFVNRGITEKSMEETTPRTRVMGVESQRGEENLQEESEIYKEKPRSIEQSISKSPLAGKGVAWSPVPKLNLMAYNNNNNNNTEEKFTGLAKSGSAMSLHSNKEEKHQPDEEKVTSEGYQSLPYRTVHSRTPSYQSNTSTGKSSGESAIANYEYEAQKENDLTFNQGDKIQILKKTENGWWIGLCNNRIGYFPSNFVTLIPGNN